MSPFKRYYRALFRTFGYPLSKQSGVSSKELAAAERRLGVKIPAALRDYYAVAGNERRFNRCHNRLLSLNEPRIERRRPSPRNWAEPVRESRTRDAVK